MTERICKNCEHWDDGRCKRYPPVIGFHLVLQQAGVIGSQRAQPNVMETVNWPRTKETDYCGEFK